jgi:hypothetical protein
MSRAYLSFVGISYKLCSVGRRNNAAGTLQTGRHCRDVYMYASHFYPRSSSLAPRLPSVICHDGVHLAVMPFVVQMIPFGSAIRHSD